jgi:hypothetical protein
MSLRTGSVKDNSYDDEKAQPHFAVDIVEPNVEDPLEANEVFKKTHDGVDFRTVGWKRASVIFLKSKYSHVRSYPYFIFNSNKTSHVRNRRA